MEKKTGNPYSIGVRVRGYIILGFSRDNGKENGIYRDYIGVMLGLCLFAFILGLYWDNGKENQIYRDKIGII